MHLYKWTVMLICMTIMLFLQPAYGHDHQLIAQGPPAAPTFSPAYGIYPGYPGGNGFAISAAAGTIYYTTDGSVPTTSSNVYNSGISFVASVQVNAIAVVSGVSSSVSTAWYAYDSNAYLVPTTNLVLWLRSDFGPLLSSGSITTWGDISLSENNATAVAPTQPTLQGNSLNAYPAATFVPGSNGQFLSLPSAVSNFTSGLSTFVVARPTSLTSGANIFSLGSGSVSSSVAFSENASLQPTLSVYSSSGTQTSVSGSTAFPTTQFQLYEAVQSGTTATLFANGIQTAQNVAMNSLPTSSATSSFIGKSTTGGNYFSGQIAEILIYSSALTQSQRTAIEAYLIQKYQIGLPIFAPAISVPTGTLTGPTMVALAAPAAETIYFTTDGTTPTTSSKIYSAPINVYFSQTINALAVNGTNQSTVSSATYTLNSLLFPAPTSGGVSLQINLTQPSTAIP